MSKRKKSYSLDDLKKIKIDEEGFKEKTSEEIEMQNKKLTSDADGVSNVNNPNFHISQKSPISDNRTAYAPYNFIPLNQKVILSDFNPDTTPMDKFHKNKFTGYIQLKIETKTPVYIRDNLNQIQLDELYSIESKIEKEKKENNKDQVKELEKKRVEKLWEYSDFFSPANGKLRIPGSSLRGLVRNMVEVGSFGRFNFFEKNKRLYFRGLADQSNLREEYTDYGLSGNRQYNMLCGILKKEGLNYYLYETGRPGQITYNDAQKEINKSGVTNFNRDIMKSYPITSKNYNIVVTGHMGGRPGKFHHWTVNFKNQKSKRIPVDERDIKDYYGDGNRADNVIDLLKEAESPNGTPCFYTKWVETKDRQEITRIYFGHTGMFRVPYKNTIGEHIPDELKDDNILDIAEAIFGNETEFAGRVFFEDSFCEQTDVCAGPKHPKILSNPKPTTFQHYLTQTSDNVRELKHYNPDDKGKISTIRGYKQYWHKSGANWEEDENNVNDKNYKQYTKINPVKPGVTFSGRIRFENLSDVELGALLFALDLPGECCHKIGMGKPLGLGSIRITPTLHLSNREKRYTNLFDEWTPDLPESIEKNKTKDEFAKFILNQLRNNKNEYTADDLWKEGRLEQLRTMLDFNKKPDNENTQYMEINRPVLDANGKQKMKNGKPETKNEFKNRPVLPKPGDVN